MSKTKKSDQSHEPGWHADGRGIPKYLAFIRVGSCGSSWGYGNTPGAAATAASKIRKQDWGKYLDLDCPYKVHVFENPESGWHADGQGIYDDSGKPLTFVQTIEF